MRWQDYLILAVLIAGYLYFRIQLRKDRLYRPPQKKKALNRKEEAVWQILKEKGYRLQEAHPSLPVSMQKNRKHYSFTYDGELSVVKDGLFYLVKIKKNKGSRIDTIASREELLLDYLSFRPAAILLFDPERGKIDKISFQIQGFPGQNRILLSVLLVIL
ncbi:MAG: hypothetical protein GX764_03775, partial [Firmicutes bacterium]|nr:hypothetical protein [Bacillota bacterium]